MKIGIDARFYGLEQGGIGRYLQELILELTKIKSNDEYVLFLKPNYFKKLKLPPNFIKIATPAPWYSLSEQLILPWQIWSADVDLMHFPHFNVPWFCPVPYIVTIHDLIINHQPQSRASTLKPWKYWLKLKGYQLLIKRALKQSKNIITPSNFVKDDICTHYPVSESKIKVTYLGCRVTKTKPNLKLKKPSKKENSKRLLYVGQAYPHKNLETLIKAFNILPADYQWQLDLVGKPNFFYKRLQAESLKILSKQNQAKLFFRGFVSDQELDKYYQAADCFIFPSLDEGFGLPPLEAMHHKIPVIAAKTSCLPEIYGKSVLFFEALNEKDLAAKIQLLITNVSLKTKLEIESNKLLKKYSWSKCLQNTLNIYQKALR